MRFGVVWSVALAANAAMASVCKPRSRDTSTASAESVTSVMSTATGTAGTTTTAVVDISTSTATSAADDTTTTANVHTTDLTSAATTSTIYVTEATTKADTTTAEPTTTSDPTTSVSAPEPFETFDVLAVGGSINGQYMKGVANEGSMMGWDLAETWIGQMPPFTIEPVTHYAKVINGLYLCIVYGHSSEPNLVAMCDVSTSVASATGFLTCEQTTDRKLKCSVPAVQCVSDPDTICAPTGEDYDQFYTYSGRSDGLWLAIESSSHPPTDSTFQPIELGITPNESK